jgi:hypothetical protein
MAPKPLDNETIDIVVAELRAIRGRILETVDGVDIQLIHKAFIHCVDLTNDLVSIKVQLNGK